MGARTFASYTRSRNCAGVYVGADHPRITMHTKPLSPPAAILYPEAVSILTVACAATFSGAALLASATSDSGVIKYSLSGRYWGFCPWAKPTCIVTNKTSATKVLLIEPRLLH